MLWRFGFHHVSKVELLLDKDGGTTIEDLFNEEDLMSEVKQHNHKLMEFLSERTNMKKMVDIIVHGDISLQKRDILLASDILTSDNWALKDALISENPTSGFYNRFETPDSSSLSQNFDSTYNPPSSSPQPGIAFSPSLESNLDKNYETPELLAILWSVIESPKGQLDSLRAGCFSKVIGMLLQYKKSEMLEFIMHQDNMVQSFINHLDVSPIMELLLKLAGMDEFSSEFDVLGWLSRQKLIQQLIDCINPVNDEETHSLAAQVLLDLIVISHCNVNKHDSVPRNILMDELKSTAIIERLLGYMLDVQDNNYSSSFINGVYILVELIRRGCSDPDQDSDSSQQFAGEDLIEMLKAISKNVDKLVGLLLNPRSSRDPIPSTIGNQIPLGFERLRVTELLAEVLHCSKMLAFNVKYEDSESNSTTMNSNICDDTSPPLIDYSQANLEPIGQIIRLSYVEHNVLKSIVDLFFEYPWNNFLHSVVYDILHQVLTLQIEDESNLNLIISLFKDAQIINRIVEAPSKFKDNPNFRMGYMGHLLGIAEEIVRLFELNHDLIIPLIDPYFDQNKWDNFVENASKEAKDRDLIQSDSYNSNESPTNSNVDSSFNELSYSIPFSELPISDDPEDESTSIANSNAIYNINDPPAIGPEDIGVEPIDLSSIPKSKASSKSETLKNLPDSQLINEDICKNNLSQENLNSENFGTDNSDRPMSLETPILTQYNPSNFSDEKTFPSLSNAIVVSKDAEIKKSNLRIETGDSRFNQDSSSGVSYNITPNLRESSQTPISAFTPNDLFSSKSKDANTLINPNSSVSLDTSSFSGMYKELSIIEKELESDLDFIDHFKDKSESPFKDELKNNNSDSFSNFGNSVSIVRDNISNTVLLNNSHYVQDDSNSITNGSFGLDTDDANFDSDGLSMQISDYFSNLSARIKEAATTQTIPNDDNNKLNPTLKSVETINNLKNNNFKNLNKPESQKSHKISNSNYNIFANSSAVLSNIPEFDRKSPLFKSPNTVDEIGNTDSIKPPENTRRRSKSHSAGVGVSRSMAVANAASGHAFKMNSTSTEFVGHIQSDDLITEGLGGPKSSMFNISSNIPNNLTNSNRPSPTLHTVSTFSSSYQQNGSPNPKNFNQAQSIKDNDLKTYNHINEANAVSSMVAESKNIVDLQIEEQLNDSKSHSPLSGQGVKFKPTKSYASVLSKTSD
ncbi:Extragenic suppressor of kinetochore protein 1 [Smittium mucronatum]|uniref:Extragenic suppressor of kinetochore protein 1 n=1 Tax=Smittium mucronatum TaxID=133383 RepID=A0A1R0GWB6_9FUNG|nr:Extragenic suppressor of kinetochore protein 1 [Smittium mucronatum]